MSNSLRMLGGVLSFRFDDWLESPEGSLRREPGLDAPQNRARPSELIPNRQAIILMHR